MTSGVGHRDGTPTCGSRSVLGWTPLAHAALVFGLVAGVTAGCGGDVDHADGTTTTVAVIHERTADQLAADQADAEDIVLTLADLDRGWDASPAADEAGRKGAVRMDEVPVDEAEIADCLGIDPNVMRTDDPIADSPAFTSADDEEVSASVDYAESIEAAEGLMELLRDEDMPSCFGRMIGDLLQDQPLPEGVEYGKPTVDPVSFADLADDTIAYRITVRASGFGVEVRVYLDLVVVRTGRVVITGSFLSPSSPFPSDEAEQLLERMIERVPPETWSQLV